VRFNTGVVTVRPIANNRWQVTLKGGEVREYRAVVIANGHLSDPRQPYFSVRFDGSAIHTHHCRTAAR